MDVLRSVDRALVDKRIYIVSLMLLIASMRVLQLPVMVYNLERLGWLRDGPLCALLILNL